MNLSSSGTLSETPFSTIVLELIGARFTGALEVTQGKVKRHVAFAGGRPVAIQSNALSESLQRLLEASGRLSADALALLRTQMKEQGKTFEALLLERGLVREADLPRLNLAVQQVRLVGLLTATEGEWQLRPMPIPAGPELPIPSTLVGLVRKKATTESPTRALVARRREAPLRVVPAPFDFNTFGLSEEARTFYETLDGSRTVGELMTGAGLPAEEAAILLQIFALAGLIRDARAEAAPAMAVAPPVVVAPPPVAATPPPVVVAPLPVAPPVVVAPPPVVVAPPVAPPVVVPPPVAPPVFVAPPPAAARAPEPARAPEAAPSYGDFSPGAGVRSSRPNRLSLDEISIEGNEAVAGRYVMGREAVARSSAESRAPLASSLSGLSIEDMISEEVGQLDSGMVVQRKVDSDPLLDFNMSAFSPTERTHAVKFKEDFVRMHKQNFFELLGIERSAKATDVRKAYFALAKEYHTDKLVSLPEPIQKLGREIFDLIQRAYDTLTDQEQREKYVAATFYGKQDDEEAAIEEVQIVLQADQHYKTGIGLLNAGNLMGAHTAFNRAREMYGKEPEYNACYGYTLFKLNYPGNAERCEEGEKLIHDALRQNPKLDRANLFLGRIYLAKENPEMAAKYFVRALKINGANIEAGRELQALKLKRDTQDTSLLGSFFGRFKK